MRRGVDQEEEDTHALSHIEQFTEDFGDEPIFKCQNCASKNPGYEEKEGSALTIIAAILSIIIFKFYAFLILPLVIEATKSIIKKCVKCDHVLDKQELLSMPSLTDKVLSFKCGNCAVVLSRKYALVLLGLLITIWFFIPASESTVVNPGGLNLNTQWQEYVEDCGRKVVLNNHIRAKRNFDQRYAKNIVRWSGALKQKSRNIDPVVGIVLDIKMNPTDSNPDYFDIQLLITKQVEARYHQLIMKLEQGDIIEFRGILKVMGDEYHFNVMEALELKETGQRIDLSDIPQINYSGGSSLRKPKTEQLAQPTNALPSPSRVDIIEKPKEQTKTEQPKEQTNTEKPKEQTNTEKPQDKKEIVDDTKKKSDANDQATPVKDEAKSNTNETAQTNDNTNKGNEQATPTSDHQVAEGNQQTQEVTQNQGNNQDAAVSDDNNKKGVPEPGVEGEKQAQQQGQFEPASEPQGDSQNDAATSTMENDVPKKDSQEPPKQKS